MKYAEEEMSQQFYGKSADVCFHEKLSGISDRRQFHVLARYKTIGCLISGIILWKNTFQSVLSSGHIKSSITFAFLR